MKRAFLALAFSDLVLMIVTAGVGLALSNTPQIALEAQQRYFSIHFLLGLLTGLYTCLVQVVAFMYFVVCYKIIRQAEQTGEVDASTAQRYLVLKSRALRASAAGIVAILAAVALGAAIHILVEPQAHLIGSIVCIVVNAAVYIHVYALIDESTRVFQLQFGGARTAEPVEEAAGTH